MEVKGGNGYRSGGGGSGGGSINVFYDINYINNGNITTNGGGFGDGTRNGESADGGTGGIGSITIGSTFAGEYVEDYSN